MFTPLRGGISAIRPKSFIAIIFLVVLIGVTLPLTGHFTTKTGYLTTYILTIPRQPIRWDLYYTNSNENAHTQSWVLIQTVYIRHPRSVSFHVWTMEDLSALPKLKGEIEIDWNPQSIQPFLRLHSELRSLFPLLLAHLWVPTTPFQTEKIGPFVFQKLPLPRILGLHAMDGFNYFIRIRSSTRIFPSSSYMLHFLDEPIISQFIMKKSTYTLFRHWHGMEIVETLPNH